MLQQTTTKPERYRKKPRPTIALEPAYVNMSGVCAFTGMSESAIRRGVKDGGFPAPKSVLGCVLWSVPELRDWAGQ